MLELLKDCKQIKSSETKYMIVATEHHVDGEEHLHACVMLNERKYYTRKVIQCGFDLLKRWKIDENGFVIPGTTDWYWLCDIYQDDDEFPKCAEDVKNGEVWERRFHPNFEGIRSPKGTVEYCKKEKNFVEYGQAPEEPVDKKTRNKRLETIPLEELVESGEISIFSLVQLKKAREILQNERTKQTFAQKDVRWYYGDTGAGKTKRCWEEAKAKYGGDIWVSHTTDQWFDGYNGQKGVILDDIRSATWRFAELLRLTDRYPIDVPIKGGFRKWVPETIWITAPVEPRELYRNYQTGEPYDGIEQLERRITTLEHLENAETAEIDSFIQKE